MMRGERYGVERGLRGGKGVMVIENSGVASGCSGSVTGVVWGWG